MRAHSTFGQCRAPCSPEVAERFYVICKRRVFDRSASGGHGALHCPSVVASTAFPSPPRVSLFPPVGWRRWGAGGRFWVGAKVLSACILLFSCFVFHIFLNESFLKWERLIEDLK